MKTCVLLALVALSSCTSSDIPRPAASPSGPPTIQPDVIAAHTEQFAEELPDRAAGSQQEFAAATYITAHLQQAGYVVEFDSVPVANAVRSTNVIALPPSTEEPQYLVVVAYDNSEEPATIGAFLELARALRAASPHHSVEFAAVGAEETQVQGGALGTRRLVKLLQDRELDPYVVELQDFALEGVVAGTGFDEDGIADQLPTPPSMRNLYERAGLDYTLVSGLAPLATEAVFKSLLDEAG